MEHKTQRYNVEFTADLPDGHDWIDVSSCKDEDVPAGCVAIDNDGSFNLIGHRNGEGTWGDHGTGLGTPYCFLWYTHMESSSIADALAMCTYKSVKIQENYLQNRLIQPR